ncbi:MAG: SWIM zinc finger family protein [Acidobacteriota bacterium]|nr:SWIM zinc finger family protein [Acidobacteriota bacterium]
MEALRQARAGLKKGGALSPVRVEGRAIATTFWGKSWCENLERYSDFANRLPRGRTYARNGSVIDLRIEPGAIEALVSGSSLYKVSLQVAPVDQRRWKSVCEDCAGGIDSLVELLQGRFSKGVMERICRQREGLFPSPAEIKLSCSCPDWAAMCKHVAAVLYGVGARFDREPELLFRLREVDEKDLIAGAGTALPLTRKTVRKEKLLTGADLSDLFGLDLGPPSSGPSEKKKKKPAGRNKATE